jgi:hypothetical protein
MPNENFAESAVGFAFLELLSVGELEWHEIEDH